MRHDNSRRHRLVIGIVVIGTLSLGGVAFASILNPGNLSPQLPKPTGSPGNYSSGKFVAGPGLTSVQATAQVLADLAGTPVQKITVGSAPSTNGMAEGIIGTGAPWLTVSVAGLDPNSTESHWWGELAQGAVADLMRSSAPTTQAVIGGGEVDGLDNSGHQVSIALGSGFVAGGQEFSSPSDDVLRAHVYDVALKFGLKVRTLTIVHPLDSAISVSFTVPDNAAVSWTIEELGVALEGSPKTLEGSFIQLYSTSGECLLSSGVAYRSGQGDLSFAPGQDARFGAMHGHLANHLANMP